MKLKTVNILFFLFLINVLYAQHANNVAFIENKNQWNDNVIYKTEFKGGAVFFEKNTLTFVLQDREAVEKILHRKFGGIVGANEKDFIVTYYAYKAVFKNTSPSVTYKGENPYSDYNNYYIGKDSKRWASNVKKYESITYKNLYDGIHLKYYEQNTTLKYEFLVEKGVDPTQIHISYEGADKLYLKKGNLYIQCGKEKFVEQKPFAYQISTSGDTLPIDCRFVVKNKDVYFKLGDYDSSALLIIDPVLVFCSYTGSKSDNWGYSATYDSEGNLYGGGSVFGVDYPLSLGAFQINYAGGSCDISISKFSSIGDTLLFSTYLGGSGSEVPHSLIVNDNNELYVLASTSSTDYPVTANAFDTVFKGGSVYLLTNVIGYLGIDIAITKFNSTGTALLGSTYFGGNGSDGLSTDVTLRKNYADEVRGEIMVDQFSNVYIVSSTSSTDLPTSASAYQRNYNGGNLDGVIAKFNYDLSDLIWCTYFGGDSSEAIYSMALDNEQNIYICGGTNSRTLPTTLGVVQPSYGGGVTDGFIAKISANGDQLLYSTYFGKETFDQTYLIEIDKAKDVYVMGLTDATGTTWVKNASWYIPNGGQIISKLSSNLSQIIWSTAFGTGNLGPDISPTAFMVDLCKNIYISGWGSPAVNSHVGNLTCGTSGLPITNDAFQKTTDNNDFYFLSLSDDASRLVFATYFGGNRSSEHVDGGTSRFDKKGCIYQAICAGCGGNHDLPVTPGVVSSINGYKNCNLGVVKIDFNLPAVVADFTCPNIICAPYTVYFVNRSQEISLFTTFYWDFGDGTSSTQKNPSHLYAKSGVYKVKLIVSDNGSCNFSDTLIREIVVLSNSNDTLPSKTICLGDFTQIGIAPAANPSVIYSWSPPNQLNKANISNPIATPIATQTYTLRISDGLCVDTLRQTVHVIPVLLDAGPRDTICFADTVILKATTIGGEKYIWSSNKLFSDTLNRPITQSTGKAIVTKDNMYYIKMTNQYCTRIDSVFIIESHISCTIDPVDKFCAGDTINLKANILAHTGGKNLYYSWVPSSYIVSGGNTLNPSISPLQPSFFNLTVQNEHGCKSENAVFVNVFTIDYELDIKHIRCYGLNDGHIIVNINPSSQPCIFKWKNNVGVNDRAKNLFAGLYSVTIYDTNGCKLTIDTTLFEPTKINTFFYDTNTYVYCNDSCSGHASGDATGGIPPYTYWWITGDTTKSITELCAGEYIFVATDKNLCQDTSKLYIVDSVDFQVSYTATPVTCFGDCDGKIFLHPTNGYPPYTYLWKDGYNKDSDSNLCAGVYDIYVKDTAHCTRRVFPIVHSPFPLNFDSIYLIRPLCYGYNNGKIMAYVSGGTPPYRFIWNGNDGKDSMTNLSVGTYNLKIIDANFCEIDTVLELLEYDSLDVSYTVIKTPCVEVCRGQATLEVSGGKPPYSYAWQNGDTTHNPKQLCYGKNTVTVTDSNGCIKILTINVEDSSYFPQKISAWADTNLIYRGLETYLNVTNLGSAYLYSWSPAEELSHPTSIRTKANPKQTTTYTVTATDTFGCKEQDTITIFVLDIICDDPYVFIPNAFTPNKDDKNDVLRVRGQFLTSVHLIIFDRWGEKVFETNDLNQGWDGTFRGKNCEPGVYVYYLEATCLGELFYFHKGNVTLIR